MQINLNILTENNHSSLLSKNVPTADNALLQYMQKVTQGTNNADTEDKKQQKLQHIVNKLKLGKKLTAQEMEFLRMNYPDEYQHALRIQKMAEMLENQLKHAKSKQEADGYIAAAVSGIPDDDPDKECLVAAFNEISKEFHHSSAYHRLPDTPEDVKKQRKNNGDNGFKRKADDDSGSDNSGDLMSWTPLQDIIDAAPTLELKG